MNNNNKILLIDDEVEFISTLAERLRLRGYAPKIAETGNDGITMLTNERFDIVVLDLMMPGLSGLDTLKQIKRIDSSLPVILLTGHGSTKDGLEGLRIGAYDYLMKPLDIKELMNKMTSALKDK
ncbi:MAG: response regulator [Desulfobacteraceae bacterium]